MAFALIARLCCGRKPGADSLDVAPEAIDHDPAIVEDAMSVAIAAHAILTGHAGEHTGIGRELLTKLCESLPDLFVLAGVDERLPNSCLVAERVAIREGQGSALHPDRVRPGWVERAAIPGGQRTVFELPAQRTAKAAHDRTAGHLCPPERKELAPVGQVITDANVHPAFSF